VRCHTKMVLVDGNGVVISSPNWSNAAMSENREAGLLLEHNRSRDYFGATFESDWSTPRKDQEGISLKCLRGRVFVQVPFSA
jgi:phosphatidylserine/phosphatidylglycerophosphate/cardiolipin synthase-like enzyme